jgi:UDP-N-acetyl-D-mannosaminuronic acid dehydrogenase
MKSTADDFCSISVIGLGYIGLPTAAMFASRKMNVIGVDINTAAVELINKGKVHIVEPDLDSVVSKVVAEGYLRATTIPEPADAFLIAVPTPFVGMDHTPDLSYVEAACLAIAPVLRHGNLVVLESTSPVGATDQVVRWLASARPDLTFPISAGDDCDIFVAHCPERVLPGRVMHELRYNDRVIGGVTKKCSERAKKLYKIFVEGECVIASSPRAAEMAKLTENSFRDVNIAFANELSVICDKLKIDVWELIGLANRHPRVNVLQPGPGVGGHCISVDPWFIVSSAPAEARLIKTAREVNDSKPEWVVNRVRSIMADIDVNGDRTSQSIVIACYGLAFKPDIDDLRESPALEIVKILAGEHSGPLLVIEPNINSLPPELGSAELVAFNAAQGADIHLLLVDHREYRDTPPVQGVIVDTRGVWQKS